MATFTQDVGDVGVPNQLGASRGYTPDRSFEVLFEGLGNTLSGATQLVDTSIKRNITDDVKAGYEGLNQPIDSIPPDLKNSASGLQALQTAYDQGKISDTYYYGTLNAQLKGLRTKYPGYEDFVDETMQSVTGVRPANAYRNAILSEINAQQNAASDTEKAWATWEKQNEADIVRAFPDYFVNPGKYSRDQVRSETVALKGREAGIQAENARINYMINQGKLTDEAATEAATTALIQQTNTFINGTGNALGFDSGDFMSRIAKGQTEGFTPEEYQQLVGQLSVAETQLRANLLRSMNSPLEEGSTNSYASVLGIEATNRLVDQSLAQFNLIKQMVVDENFGMAGYYVRLNQVTKDRSTSQILNASPELATYNSLAGIDPALAQIWLQEGANQDSVISALGPELMARIVGGEDTFTDAIGRIDSSTQTPEEKSAGVNVLLDSSLATIVSGTATPEQVSSAVNNLYTLNSDGKDLFNMVEPAEYSALYHRIFNPQVVQALTASGDTASLQKFYDAARDRLTAIPEFSRIAANVQDKVDWQKGISVKFDPNNGRLSIVGDITQAGLEGIQYGQGNALANQVFNTTVREANAAVNELNNLFSTFSPVLDGLGVDKNLKAGVYKDILSDLRVDVENGKQEGFFDWLGKNVESGIQGATEGIGNAVTESLQGTSDALFAPPPEGAVAAPDGASPSSLDVLGQLFGGENPQDNDITFQFEKVIAGTMAQDPAAMAQATNAVDAARAFIGYQEANPEQNTAIANFISQATGENINPQETAWCAAFLNAIFKSQGGEGTGALNARSYLNWGDKVDTPEVGDVVVFSRGDPNGWKGHVGLFLGWNADGTVKVLGGNQSDSVAESDYDASKILGFRRARPIN